jgi:hypothetical protein
MSRLPLLGIVALLGVVPSVQVVSREKAADWNGDGRPDLIVSRHERYRVGEGSYSTRKHHVWVYLHQAR